MRGSRTLAALTLAAALAAGCGGDDKQATSTANDPGTPAVKPTATDLKIAALVQDTGARLHVNAIRLVGDRALLADPGALRSVAATRLKAAARLEGEARAANEELDPLAAGATAATQLAAAGRKAFDELAACGRVAAAFFSTAVAGKAGELDGPTAACKSARLAYGQAKTLADGLQRAA